IHSMLDLMRKSECTYCVMEVSSHALDQKRVFGIEFEAAMFTNLTQDHLDYHKTMENYFAAKLKLFDQAKIGIVNFDDESCRKIIEYAKCEINTYSIKSGEATYSAKNINNRPNGVDFMFVGYNLINQIKMSTGGEFTVYNALCAVGCALSLGVKLADAAEALGKYKGVKGRAEVVPCDRDFTVIIDYAHTPDGVENILKMFGNCEKNRLIALFGCGGDRDRTKRSQMGAVAAQLSDYMIITSDNPRTEEPAKIIEDILEGVKGYETPYKVIENRVEAIKYAIKNAQKGDIIVLMGKGHETYQILSDGVIHLDEREVVAQALN
ncbi:MAG: UDP-N-acetylmuramoyl-L-alanyl-D-glutamate--2,6-diaminopimelate ligase, partial [bacterium]|nr:UDP-N-acetylmuramoyl-L-alanyl-D-glutamate--2,6-diaminopimelate ligase [bacterium]